MVINFSILNRVGYHLLLRYSMVWYRMQKFSVKLRIL